MSEAFIHYSLINFVSLSKKCSFSSFQGHIRALSLRVLREIVRNQPHHFKDYVELTILKVLEAHKDPVKEVRASCISDASELSIS